MALTHVCRWSKEKKRWVHVSVDEAVKMYPYQTVSADAGLFMCDLCKQYVTLTNGRKYRRYFRHSSGDSDKTCIERSSGQSVFVYMDPEKHNLPIRMFINRNQIRFEIGFFSVPEDIFSGDRGSITIDTDYQSFRYSFERLFENGITYLPVGDKVSKEYRISVESMKHKSYSRYWPSHISGVANGSMFDAETNKKLPEDADVTVRHHYYLLTTYSRPASGYRHIYAEKKAEIKDEWFSWKIFDIYAETYDTDVARFFFEHSCRLTEKPTKMYPIWPPYIASPYFVHHQGSKVFLYADGDGIAVRTSPEQYIRQEKKLLSIQQRDKYALVSIGRLKVIRYLYLAREKIGIENTIPKFLITDDEGERIEPGEYNKLPKAGHINIEFEFDGFIKIFHHSELVRKEKIPSKSPVRIESITFETTIEAYIGFDCVWSSAWKKERTQNEDEQEFLDEIKRISGNEIPVSHAVAYIYHQLSQYPNIQKWIASRQRIGSVPEKSIKILRNLLLKKRNGE